MCRITSRTCAKRSTVAQAMLIAARLSTETGIRAGGRAPRFAFVPPNLDGFMMVSSQNI